MFAFKLKDEITNFTVFDLPRTSHFPSGPPPEAPSKNATPDRRRMPTIAPTQATNSSRATPACTARPPAPRRSTKIASGKAGATAIATPCNTPTKPNPAPATKAARFRAPASDPAATRTAAGNAINNAGMHACVFSTKSRPRQPCRDQCERRDAARRRPRLGREKRIGRAVPREASAGAEHRSQPTLAFVAAEAESEAMQMARDHLGREDELGRRNL